MTVDLMTIVWIVVALGCVWWLLARVSKNASRKGWLAGYAVGSYNGVTVTTACIREGLAAYPGTPEEKERLMTAFAHVMNDKEKIDDTVEKLFKSPPPIPEGRERKGGRNANL